MKTAFFNLWLRGHWQSTYTVKCAYQMSKMGTLQTSELKNNSQILLKYFPSCLSYNLDWF